MTDAQKRALKKMEGEQITEWKVRKLGFQLRTFEALAASGKLRREVVQGRCRPFVVYTHPDYVEPARNL